MKTLIAILTVFSAVWAMAETTKYDVSGMSCGACVKKMKAAVCDKIKDDAKTCDVTVGTMTITPKDGKTVDTEKVKALVAATNEFAVTKTEPVTAAKK